MAAPAFQLKVADQAEAQRLLLKLQSNDERALCLEYGAWPSAVAGPPISLRGGTVVLPRQTAAPLEPYCPGGCDQIRIPPRGQLSAAIPYSDFGDPIEIASWPARQLEFAPQIRVCRK
ncbi:hypothetical protein GCM10027188_29080 [Lysobacter humi (ex Lee et al. 2017)]